MDSTNLLEINKANATQALGEARHKELLAYQAKTADNVLLSTEALIKFLEGKVSKTEVVNQLQSISTPDVEYVVKALNVLDDTLKTHENTDLTEITQVMREVLAEAKAIPKDHKDVVIPDTVSVSNQVDNTKELNALLKAIQAIKLVAEAPVVNVPAPVVHAEPDLSSLLDKMTESIKVIKKGQADVEDGAMRVHETGGLITEKFDEYKIVYKVDDFDEDAEAVVSKIKYLLDSKVVATLKYSYDKQGNLTGGKKL